MGRDGRRLVGVGQRRARRVAREERHPRRLFGRDGRPPAHPRPGVGDGAGHGLAIGSEEPVHRPALALHAEHAVRGVPRGGRLDGSGLRRAGEGGGPDCRRPRARCGPARSVEEDGAVGRRGPPGIATRRRASGLRPTSWITRARLKRPGNAPCRARRRSAAGRAPAEAAGRCAMRRPPPSSRRRRGPPGAP